MGAAGPGEEPGPGLHGPVASWARAGRSSCLVSERGLGSVAGRPGVRSRSHARRESICLLLVLFAEDRCGGRGDALGRGGGEGIVGVANCDGVIINLVGDSQEPERVVAGHRLVRTWACRGTDEGR